MNRKIALSVSALSLAFVLVGPMAPASAASSEPETDASSTSVSEEPGNEDHVEPYVDTETGELIVDEEDKDELVYGTPPLRLEPYKLGGVKKSGKCKFQHGGDDPHVTKGEVSAHGWWVIKSGSNCAEKAKVRNKLEAWACTKKKMCSWVTQKTGDKYSIAPGTQKRSNVRTKCRSGKLVGWRNLVDVDLEWHVDPAGWDNLGQRNLKCSPGK